MPPTLIAIVDDSAMIRAALSSLLRSYGYAVQVFASGEALLADDATRFACVVSDLQMAGMSGLELRRELSRGKISVPMILMTACPNTKSTRQAEQAGIRAVLEKPIDSTLLATTIAAALA